MDFSKLISDSVIGRMFKSTSFSLGVVAILVIGGVFTAPVTGPAMYVIAGAYAAYLARETARDHINAKVEIEEKRIEAGKDSAE